jgi:hypothetical protein
VGVFDEYLKQRLNDQYKTLKFVGLPDVAEQHCPNMESSLIRHILEKAGNRIIVSLVGSLDRRKNVLSFLRTAESCRSDDLFFVCAGKLHVERFPVDELEEIEEIVRTSADKIFFHDDFIESDQVFDALFEISSIVFAVYTNFASSSNIIVKASQYGVPIIVSEGHLMGELVDQYNLGVCIKDFEPVVILEAIRKLISEDRVFGFEQFNVDHSVEHLKKMLGQMVWKDSDHKIDC